MNKRMCHFSIYDVTLADDHMFQHLVTWHEVFDLKVSLYCYASKLSEVPNTTFFCDNYEWLKLGFHSRDESHSSKTRSISVLSAKHKALLGELAVVKQTHSVFIVGNVPRSRNNFFQEMASMKSWSKTRKVRPRHCSITG